MRIPPCFAAHVKAFHGFVAAENVLDGAGHDVMNSRDAIGRRRPFVENKRGMAFGKLQAFYKGVVFLPVGLDLIANPRQVKVFIFGISCAHFSFSFVWPGISRPAGIKP